MENGKHSEKSTKIKEAARKIRNVKREDVKDVLLKEEMSKKHKFILLTLTSVLIAFIIYVGINFILANVGSIENYINEIDLNEYVELKNAKEKSVIYIASRGNEINEDYELILRNELRKRNVKIEFLDLTPLKENNQIITFMNADELTKDTYTEPMILVFENGKLKDSLLGISSKTDVIEFFDANRID